MSAWISSPPGNPSTEEGSPPKKSPAAAAFPPPGLYTGQKGQSGGRRTGSPKSSRDPPRPSHALNRGLRRSCAILPRDGTGMASAGKVRSRSMRTRDSGLTEGVVRRTGDNSNSRKKGRINRDSTAISSDMPGRTGRPELSARRDQAKNASSRRTSSSVIRRTPPCRFFSPPMSYSPGSRMRKSGSPGLSVTRGR